MLVDQKAEYREKFRDFAFLILRRVPYETAILLGDDERRELVNAFLHVEGAERRYATHLGGAEEFDGEMQ